MKMRLRNVDDGTASGVNPATCVYQTMQCDGIDVLVFIVLMFLNSAVMPWLWKADIKSAFRRCPLRSAHQQFAAVVFLVSGVPHMAEQDFKFWRGGIGAWLASCVVSVAPVHAHFLPTGGVQVC